LNHLNDRCWNAKEEKGFYTFFPAQSEIKERKRGETLAFVTNQRSRREKKKEGKRRPAWMT